MKTKILLLYSIGILITGCSRKDFKIVIDNPSGFDRQNETVEIPLTVVEKNIKLRQGEVYLVKSLQGEIIPSQVTYDNKLIFQVDIRAKEAIAFAVAGGEPVEFLQKAYARFIPEHKDDFAWENDKVTFRTYGQQRIKTDGFSNGIDIWYKRTGDLVIDKWYREENTGISSYREDTGEGLVDYTVGRSLGAGAMAPYIKDSLWLNENFISYEILDNGPLRTTFLLKYKDLEVDGNILAETRTISLDAGSCFTKIVQEYKGINRDITVAAGFVKQENDSVIVSMKNNYILYLSPAHEKIGDVFLGVIFPEGLQTALVNQYHVKDALSDGMTEYSHILGIVPYHPGMPVVYYTGFGWSGFGFNTLGEFQEYMDNFSVSLAEPLKINY